MNRDALSPKNFTTNNSNYTIYIYNILYVCVHLSIYVYYVWKCVIHMTDTSFVMNLRISPQKHTNNTRKKKSNERERERRWTKTEAAAKDRKKNNVHTHNDRYTHSKHSQWERDTDTNKYTHWRPVRWNVGQNRYVDIGVLPLMYNTHQFNSADLTIDCVFFLVSYSRYFSPNSMLRIPKPPSFFVIYPTLPALLLIYK